jgi:hypothetical protein
MLKRAAWPALRIEAGLFSIVVAAAIQTNVFLDPGPHSRSLILVYAPLASQFAGVAVVHLLPLDTHINLMGAVVCLVQYLTYAGIVLVVLSWRSRR